MKRKEKTAVILAGLSGCMWGTIGLFVHVLETYGIDAVTLTSGRFLIASALLGIYLTAAKRELPRIRLCDLPLFMIAGVFFLLFFNVSYGITIEESSMSLAAVLLYTSPAIVSMLQVMLFHEKMTLRKVAAVVLSVAGCALVSGIMKGSFAYPVSAYLWGFGSALGYSLYGLLSSFLLKRYRPLTVLFYAFLFAAAGSCTLGNLRGLLHMIAECPARLFWLVGAALVCNILAYFCYNFALQFLNPDYVMVVASVEPVVASLLGLLVFKEPMDLFGVLGVGCILAAIAVGNGTSETAEERKNSSLFPVLKGKNNSHKIC